ncbi:hypothetical protein DM02DRAFT_612879 [Periconia macrospinosa]|uniref:Restriction of telomere capping protein 4 n=1 Tax=Periconia macrospinosa TaxID=97972 RepID=A0A2V1DYQ6_9PLEO|nr:hypothetical protein DM02DRAFT_612879 [Periconia macrospinosa]
MPLLKRNAPRLLRTVGGKEHAGPQHHEEEAASQRSAKNKQLTEDEINADPMSSSDEIEAEIIRRSELRSPPPPLASKTSKRAVDSKRMNKKSTSVNNGSAKTKRTKKQPAKTMSVPSTGQYSEGQRNKRKINGVADEEKENIRESSNGSRDNWEGEFGWGTQSSASSKKQRVSGPTTYSSSSRSNTSNIHASQATNGKKTTYKKGFQRVPGTFTTKEMQPTQDDSESEVSMADGNDDLDAELDKLTTAAAKRGINIETKKSPPPSPPPKSRPDLFASLGLYKQPESSPPDSNLDTPATSQDPHALCNLENEIANLPSEEALNSTCPLCHKPVDPSHSIRFWKYHKRTIRNQSTFCKEHRERTAKVKYKERGYPEIVWSRLPARIRKLRPRLERVLRNEEGFESKYRTKNAAKLVSGQAAVYRPKQKKSKKNFTSIENLEDVEDDMELLHNDSSTSTGYYGPRGQRLMMEVLTTDLGDVFREVAVSDPVVGKSGFAEYIEHVLVPELTVMLVMDDVDVGEREAEEVIAQSTELGTILHEDIDDVVAERSDEEEEEMELLDLDDDEKYEELA